MAIVVPDYIARKENLGNTHYFVYQAFVAAKQASEFQWKALCCEFAGCHAQIAPSLENQNAGLTAECETWENMRQ